MLYVAGEILLWMFLAFALGLLVGFFVWGVRERKVQPPKPAATTAAHPASDIESVTVRAVAKPVPAVATAPAVGAEFPVTPPAGQPAVPPLSPPAGEPVIGAATGDLPTETAEPPSMQEAAEPDTVEEEPESPSDDLAALVGDDDPSWSDASSPTPAVGQPVVETSERTADGDVSAGTAALGRPVTANDLTIIEGIGEGIEGVLLESGIATWSDLAGATPERLRTLLDLAGDQYRTHDPSTWPQQAELAEAGRWDELAALQASLTAGPP